MNNNANNEISNNNETNNNDANTTVTVEHMREALTAFDNGDVARTTSIEVGRYRLILQMVDSGADLEFARDAIDIVDEVQSFARNAKRIEALNAELHAVGARQRNTKERLVVLLQRNSHRPWDSIKKAIRIAVIASQYHNPDALMSTLKLCFKERILPADLNPDRLKKAATWQGWNGENINRAVTKKPASTTPAKPASTTPAKPASTTPASTTPASTTPAKPASTTPAKPASTTPASTTPAKVPAKQVQESDAILSKAASKTDDTDALSELEHWYTLLLQFQRHPLTIEYLGRTAGILGMQFGTLCTALQHAEQSIRAEGDAIKTKAGK